MAKVYIVTSGSYSDYHIKRVFLEREKAERYARLSDDYEAEEYSTDDDAEYSEFLIIHAGYYPPDSDMAAFHFYTERANTLDATMRESSEYYEEDGEIVLVRTAPVDADTYVLEGKYRRVCEDLYAQIRSLIDIERWTPDMVSEWLADKARYEDVMKTEVSGYDEENRS